MSSCLCHHTLITDCGIDFVLFFFVDSSRLIFGRLVLYKNMFQFLEMSLSLDLGQRFSN